MKAKLVLTYTLLSLVSIAHAESTSKLGSLKKDYSYTLGYQIGRGLKRDRVDVDPSLVQQGLQDVLNDATPKLSPSEMQAAILAEQEQRKQKLVAAAQKSRAAGEAFLQSNKTRKGVVTLSSGLQYEVLKAGTGKRPAADGSVIAHYRGTLINGTEFDSSYKRGKPATFSVNGVIKGWQEVLPKMQEGAKWKVYIPSELAYGAQGAGQLIGPHETLIFDIELITVK